MNRPNTCTNLIKAINRIAGPQREAPVTDGDARTALDSAVAFAKAEFGTGVTVERFDEKIPNTRAPYHVTFLVKVDASKRVAELAA